MDLDEYAILSQSICWLGIISSIYIDSEVSHFHFEIKMKKYITKITFIDDYQQI